MISRKSFIGGNSEKVQGSYFALKDPSTRKRPMDYQSAGTGQIDNVTESASNAYPIYKHIDFDKLSAFINDTANDMGLFAKD